MVSSMNHCRDQDEAVPSLSLSLSLGAVADCSKKMRRGGAAGEFVCKTCSRAFPSFQALGLTAGSTEPATKKATDQKQAHQCHVCGLEFEMGQALGGHMRRHRAQEATTTAQARACSAPALRLALH